MCVAAIAWAAHPRWRMVAIGNRDEFHARPAAPLARWADGRVIAGRDLEAGGTWLGVSEGRFGLVTNLRTPGYPMAELASRGALVTDWLRGTAPGQKPEMNPFNLWLADGAGLRVVTNQPGWETLELGPGIHGLSNGAHRDRWFKTARLKRRWASGLTIKRAKTPCLPRCAMKRQKPPIPRMRFHRCSSVGPLMARAALPWCWWMRAALAGLSNAVSIPGANRLAR